MERYRFIASPRMKNPFFTYDDLLSVLGLPDPDYLIPPLLCKCRDGLRCSNSTAFSFNVSHCLKQITKEVRAGNSMKPGVYAPFDTVALSRSSHDWYRRNLSIVWFLLQCTSCFEFPVTPTSRVRDAETWNRYQSEVQNGIVESWISQRSSVEGPRSGRVALFPTQALYRKCSSQPSKSMLVTRGSYVSLSIGALIPTAPYRITKESWKPSSRHIMRYVGTKLPGSHT